MHRVSPIANCVELQIEKCTVMKKLKSYQFGMIIVTYVGRVSFLFLFGVNGYGTLKASSEITRRSRVDKKGKRTAERE